MKGLLFSDLHIYPSSRFASTLANGMNSRLAEILETLKKLVEEANKPDIEFVMCGGDIFNDKDKVDVRAFTEAVLLFSKIRKPVICVTGNHDFAARKSGEARYSALKIFKELNVQFYLDEEVTLINSEMNQKFVAVPYKENVENLIASIEKIDRNAVLLLHAEVKGAADNGYVFKQGLPVSLLKQFKFCAVGHIHAPAILAENVLIPGSPLHHDFGDAGRPAYYWKIDIGASKVRLEACELDSPRFIICSAEEFRPEFVRPKWYVRVIGELSDEQVAQVTFENIECIPTVSSSPVSVGRGGVSVLLSKEELLQQWVKFKQVPADLEEAYVTVGKELLK